MQISEKYRIFKYQDYEINPADQGLKRNARGRVNVGSLHGVESDDRNYTDQKSTNLGGGSGAELKDFKIWRVLGRGAFGKVFLVKHKDDDKTWYAMKAMRKD